LKYGNRIYSYLAGLINTLIVSMRTLSPCVVWTDL